MAFKSSFDLIRDALQNNKIMPRSVNSVAKEQEEKNNEASQRILW
jgi:hypothetical protein